MNISTQATTHIMYGEYNFEKGMRKSFGALCVGLVLLYAYLAGASVLHAVSMRSTEVNIEAKKMTLAQFERDYFVLSGDISPALAVEFNLERVEQKQYVTRGTILGQHSARGGI